jgi:hypothetical protein
VYRVGELGKYPELNRRGRDDKHEPNRREDDAGAIHLMTTAAKIFAQIPSPRSRSIGSFNSHRGGRELPFVSLEPPSPPKISPIMSHYSRNVAPYGISRPSDLWSSEASRHSKPRSKTCSHFWNSKRQRGIPKSTCRHFQCPRSAPGYNLNDRVVPPRGGFRNLNPYATHILVSFPAIL